MFHICSLSAHWLDNIAPAQHKISDALWGQHDYLLDVKPLPTKLRKLSIPKVLLKQHARLDDAIYKGPYGLVVSQRVVSAIQGRDADGFEKFDIDVMVGGSRKATSGYSLLNVWRVIDCVNLTASKARAYRKEESEASHIEHLTTSRNDPYAQLIIDPTRVPEDVFIFCPRHYLKVICVRTSIVSSLKKAGCTGFAFHKLRNQVEQAADRRQTLARIRREVRVGQSDGRTFGAHDEADHEEPPLTWPEVSKEAGIRIPKKSAMALRLHQTSIVGRQEIYSGRMALDATAELRRCIAAWPRHYLVISDDGRGGYFVLDTSKAIDGDCPVLYCDHEAQRGMLAHPEVAATTLGAWIRRLQRGGEAMRRA